MEDGMAKGLVVEQIAEQSGLCGFVAVNSKHLSCAFENELAQFWRIEDDCLAAQAEQQHFR